MINKPKPFGLGMLQPDIATAAWSRAFKLHGPKKIQVDASSDVRNMAQVNRTANFLNGLTPHYVKAVAIVYLRLLHKMNCYVIKFTTKMQPLGGCSLVLLL
jgi:hypothetical protein